VPDIGSITILWVVELCILVDGLVSDNISILIFILINPSGQELVNTWLLQCNKFRENQLRKVEEQEVCFFNNEYHQIVIFILASYSGLPDF
jgi:hypothetical protein